MKLVAQLVIVDKKSKPRVRKAFSAAILLFPISAERTKSPVTIRGTRAG
jgi:hypothetical protein